MPVHGPHRSAEQGSLDSGSLNPHASQQGSRWSSDPGLSDPVTATGGLSDPCGDACGLSDPESSDPCPVAGVPCLAVRWSSDPGLVLAFDCREEVRGLSDPCTTSLISISMIGRLEALLGCMILGTDTTR